MSGTEGCALHVVPVTGVTMLAGGACYFSIALAGVGSDSRNNNLVTSTVTSPTAVETAPELLKSAPMLNVADAAT